MNRWVISILALSLLLLGAAGVAQAGWRYYNQSDYRVKVRYKVVVSRYKLSSTKRYYREQRGWKAFYLNPGQSRYIRRGKGNWRGTSWSTFLSKVPGAGHVWVTKSGKSYYIKNNHNLMKHHLNTVLLNAVSEGNLINVKGVIKNGCNVNGRRQYARSSRDTPTALHYAVWNNHLEIVRYLISRGAWINILVKPGYGYQGNKGRFKMELAGLQSALHIAVFRNNTAMVRLLLDKGARPSLRTAKGTAIQYARSLGRHHLVRLMQRKSGRIGTVRTGHQVARFIPPGETLHLAANRGHLVRVKALIRHGVPVDKRDAKGQTALYMAAAGGRLQMVKYLVGRGADINGRTKEGDTALLYAAYKGFYHIVKYLYRKYARINLRGKYGDTALTVAAMKGHLKIVRFLVHRGADLKARNIKGRTALTYALMKRNHRIAAILRQAARKVGY